MDVTQLKKTLETEELFVNTVEWKHVNYSAYLKSTNEILKSKVEEKNRIKRLQNNQQRINFAEEGMRIHKHQSGEICAFCGNAISEETFQELESYFSADEVAILKNRIVEGKKKVSQLSSLIISMKWTQAAFYPEYQETAGNILDDLVAHKKIILSFCDALEDALESKEKNLFSELDELDIEVPEDFDFSSYNSLVKNNKEYGASLATKKREAQEKLRYNMIYKLLGQFKYDVKCVQMNDVRKTFKNVKEEFDKKVGQQADLEADIQNLNDQIDALKPKAEVQAIKNINKRLQGVVPWQLTYTENEETGYYQVSQTVGKKSTLRRVKELSTGEKNVIALLYFLEKLGETTIQTSTSPKLIIFDDPMNSNDSDMQYLIITEMQKLYQGKQRERFDHQKDFIVIMTHNIHLVDCKINPNAVRTKK
ncbi:AAA family ATPase, partial [Lactiplantibacillus plantarum]|nr:AAA family ATPase [Lactiplantibacillus plantarum]